MKHVLLFALLVCAACHKHEDRHDPAVGSAQLALAVTIDGAAATWQQASFDRVPRVAGNATDGEARDTWSLRELAHQLVGPNARVVTVTGDVAKPIDPTAWADPNVTPILHTTKRGTLKFRWANRDGTWRETEVKDVTKLEIAR